jgi:hypothetical protein
MEGEDSFEAIVAKAVYEVNRNQLLCLSGLKLFLALARSNAALEALRQPKSQHLSHTVVWISQFFKTKSFSRTRETRIEMLRELIALVFFGGEWQLRRSRKKELQQGRAVPLLLLLRTQA